MDGTAEVKLLLEEALAIIELQRSRSAIQEDLEDRIDHLLEAVNSLSQE